MRSHAYFRTLVFVILISLVASLGFSTSARADLPVSETGLKPEGGSWEINPDPTGKLWITDYLGGEIRSVNPATGEYDAYAVGGSPVDARQAKGWLWWADALAGFIGRLPASGGTAMHWQIPTAVILYSTYLDGQERLYVLDADAPSLYRLDASTNELCTFTLPTQWGGSYVVSSADYLWLTDWYKGRILRLQPDINNNNLTVWTLPDGSSPFGTAVDAQGNLWYAESSPHAIARLNPNTHQVTQYDIPEGGDPKMLTIQAGIIWYTTTVSGTIGRLDPSSAAYTTFSPAHDTSTMKSICHPITPEEAGSITPSHGSLSWSASSYPTLVDSGGWQIYSLPVDSIPSGITLADYGYMVDAGRNVLSRFSIYQLKFYLPVVLN